MTREEQATREYRALLLLLLVVGVVSIVGFLAGTRDPAPAPSPRVERPQPTSGAQGVPPAASYAELRQARRGPNAAWRTDFASLSRTEATALPPGTARDQAREETLQARATLRAYEGAPPVIPHPVDQRGVPGCLSCHGEGASFDGRRAPRMSHPEYASCTQCHAPPAPFDAKLAMSAGNSFQGLEVAPTGSRAWFGAPPEMPHKLHMREECSSCHGPHGQPGMRTTHPERQSCTQCHAPSAVLNQRP